jgi:hypothetical protein
VQDVFERQPNRPLHEATACVHGPGDVRAVRLRDDGRDQEGPVRLLPLHRLQGPCGNTYVREEELSRLFADVVRASRSGEVADWIAEALRESQDDKERFHRTSVLRLQQQYLAVQAKLDRAYEDRLAGRISDELWQRKSKSGSRNWRRSERDTALHESRQPRLRPRARRF